MNCEPVLRTIRVLVVVVAILGISRSGIARAQGDPVAEALEHLPSWSSADRFDAHALAWGDVDLDGDLDLALGAADGAYLFINRAGRLDHKSSWMVEASGTQGIAWGDIDADGWLDLVLANAGSENMLFLNDGTGRLGQQAAWTDRASDNSRAVGLADVDGDAKLDLFFANGGDAGAPNRAYFNAGGLPEASPSWQSIESDDSRSLALGDGDGDGDIDLAIGNDFDSIRVYTSENGVLRRSARPSTNETPSALGVAWGQIIGTNASELFFGAFGAKDGFYFPTVLRSSPESAPELRWETEDALETTGIALGDVNGDGILDFATAGGRLRLYEPGSRGGRLGEIKWTSEGADRFVDVTFADVDGDGDLDLTGANTQLPVRTYANHSPPFESRPSWISDPRPDLRAAEWGDVDRDGDPDLAIGLRAEFVHLFLNHDGDIDPYGSPDWTADDIYSPFVLRWGDMNGDGWLDLAAGGVGHAVVYLNDGAGALGAQPNWQYSNPVLDIGDLAWGDRDRDGDADLALSVAGYGGARKSMVFDNLGGQLGTEPIWAQTTVGSFGASWTDFDNDGWLDLALGHRLYRGSGQGLSERPDWTPLLQGSPGRNAWIDIDLDGHLDLAVANYQGNGPNRVYRNLPSADGRTLERESAWEARRWDETVRQPYTHDVEIGDINRDGIDDLVFGTKDGFSTTAYLSDSTGIDEIPDWGSQDRYYSYDISLADMDGDSDLDLFSANGMAPSGVYRNDGSILSDSISYEHRVPNSAAIAWADHDLDGDLDLAVAGRYGEHEPGPLRLFSNDRGTLLVEPHWQSEETLVARALAWGDVDRDGDPDLAIAGGSSSGEALIYRNDTGRLESMDWSPQLDGPIASVDWADVDADGELDLAMSDMLGGWRVFLGRDGSLQDEPTFAVREEESTHGLAWGDLDGDGHPELATAGHGPIRVYPNIDGRLRTEPMWSSEHALNTLGLAWGDADGDGDLDLAAANTGRNAIFFNQHGALDMEPGWRSDEAEHSTSVSWGDALGDGDLDLLFTNAGPDHVYVNDMGALETRARWTADRGEISLSAAWGDMDGDGRLDIAIGTGQSLDAEHRPAMVYRATHIAHPRGYGSSGVAFEPHEPGAGSGSLQIDTRLASGSEAPLGLANGIWTTRALSGARLPISYTIMHPSDLSARKVRAWYALDGGSWTPALPSAVTSTENQPTHTPLIFDWDVFGSGLFGASNHVRLRMEVLPQVKPQEHSIAGTYQRPLFSSETYPFAIRGQQIQVLDPDGVPVEAAMVYRLPAGDVAGGRPMADQAGRPFLTDAGGFLQGRGEVYEGDRLLALAPASLPENLRSALGDRLRLYHTNGRVTEQGVEAQLVSLQGNEQGIHRLTVSPDQPLMIFDMDISLEWDASATPKLDKLSADIRSASAHLYDFTNGQVALGDVRLFQNGDEWAFAHTVIRASNRLRPFAVQGGAILEPLADPDHPEIVYGPGQVVMGAEWNRYGGGRDDSSADDWALMLAHELGHYLLFLDDTYLGLDERERLIPVTSCTGSAMGDMYGSDENREFVPDGAHWDTACGQTLTARTLGRSEWGTITRWFPFLNPPEHHAENPGPKRMPYALTEVRVQPPITRTASSTVESIFFLDYAAGESPSSDARAYRLARRDGASADDAGDWEFVIDLGSPTAGDGHSLTALGIQPGDRLCLFDPTRRQQGCEIVRDGDERIALQHLPEWRPELTLRPVNTTTLSVRLEGSGELSAGEELWVQVFPELGPASEALRLEPDGRAWTGVIALAHASFSGHARAWVQDGAGQDTDPREIIVGWQVAGNPGPIRGGGPAWRGAGGNQRGGGPAWRGAGGSLRGGGAPVASADGRMIVYTPNPLDLEVGTLFAVQELAALPPLPSNKTAIGQGYSIVGSDAAPADIPGSVSFQYRGVDAAREGADRAALKIHHWSDGRWQVLPTTTEPRYNFASASSAGQGSYALLDGVTLPRVDDFVPGTVESGRAVTITLVGGDFLAPVQVELVDRGLPQSLPARMVEGGRIELTLPANLPPGAYRLSVINGDGGRATAARRLSVLEPVEACFHDFFESGASQWSLDEPWDIVQLADGQRALSDSPSGPYLGATGSETRRIQATSRAFTLDSSRCSSPALSFRHAHALAQGDRARVELLDTSGSVLQVVLPDVTGYSEDQPLIGEGLDSRCTQHCGSAWSKLVDILTRPLMLRNDGSIPLQAAPTDEWRADELRDVGPLPIGPRDESLRLRLVLEVDDRGSDRGWLIDDIAVHAAGITAPRPRPLRLPYELWLPSLGGGG